MRSSLPQLDPTTEKIVNQITEDIYEAYPFLMEKYGENGKKHTRDDLAHHMNHLKTAHELQNDQFFIDYSVWLNNILTSRGMQTSLIIDSFRRIDKAIDSQYTEEVEAAYRSLLSQAIQTLQTLQD